MATEQNFEFQLNEDWEIAFELNDASDDDLDLSGATVAFTLAEADEVLLTLSSEGDDVAIDSPPAGAGVITIPPTEQSDLYPGTFNYEVRAILADGRITVQAFGKIIARASLFGWPPGSTTGGT